MSQFARTGQPPHSAGGVPHHRGAARWWPLLGLALLLAGAGRVAGGEPVPAAEPERGAFHLIFSTRMFTEVHENDAKAALIAWAEVVMRERHLRFTPEPRVVDGVPALLRAANGEQDNFVTVSTEEYLQMNLPVARDSIIVGTVAGDPFVTYLLLVNRDSGIHDLAGLKGRTVLVYENPRTSLAACWLDEVLLEHGLPPAAAYCGTVNRVRKLSGVVLPVFFKQADACIVTRDGLGVLGELNPQVGGQLRLLTTSPALVPSVAFVQERRTESFRGVDIFTEVRLLHTSTPGKQLLSLFKVDQLQTLPVSAIATARELLETRQRLMRRWQSGTPASRHPAGATRAARAEVTTAEGGQ